MTRSSSISYGGIPPIKIVLFASPTSFFCSSSSSKFVVSSSSFAFVFELSDWRSTFFSSSSSSSPSLLLSSSPRVLISRTRSVKCDTTSSTLTSFAARAALVGVARVASLFSSELIIKKEDPILESRRVDLFFFLLLFYVCVYKTLSRCRCVRRRRRRSRETTRNARGSLSVVVVVYARETN